MRLFIEVLIPLTMMLLVVYMLGRKHGMEAIRKRRKNQSSTINIHGRDGLK